jgi:hypothetical protein
MSILQARDGEQTSYLEIAEAIEERSPAVNADLRELWRRIVFTILISNTDDHLRNHGFLRESTAGWSLSPAFDLNPNPEGAAKQLATAIDESNASSAAYRGSPLPAVSPPKAVVKAQSQEKSAGLCRTQPCSRKPRYMPGLSRPRDRQAGATCLRAAS